MKLGRTPKYRSKLLQLSHTALNCKIGEDDYVVAAMLKHYYGEEAMWRYFQQRLTEAMDAERFAQNLKKRGDSIL